MSIIYFKVKLIKVGSWTLLCLPKSASAKLPSRGLVMVQGTINGIPFHTPLEPDGKGSHWLRVETGGQAGAIVSVAIEPTEQWIEPAIPSDLLEALASSNAQEMWCDITPMARWDWIRWIRSTNHSDTRSRRIKRACAMLLEGKRRPCCFNRNLCTEMAISKNGTLFDR